MNFVTSASENEIFMNGVKRRALHPPNVDTVAGSSNTTAVPRISSAPLALQSENIVLNSPPEVIKKKVVTRRRVQAKFPVSLKKKKIWSRMLSADAGLSIGEWVYHDDNAANEIINGIRYLRDMKREEKRRLRKSRSNAAGKAPANPIVIDSPNNNMMDIDSNAAAEINLVEDEYSSVDSGDDDISVTSFGSSSSVKSFESGGESLNSLSDERNVDSDIDFNDNESIYCYPYSLEAMKQSSPLRGTISINGVSIKVYFDTGASVSIIGSNLVKTLGLVPCGDKLNLVGFNSNGQGPMSSNIVMDVPISIGGRIRPEHMCIDENENSNLCLLGLRWFQSYGISIEPQKNLILVPTTEGVMKIKAFSKQFDEYEEKVVSGSKVKKIYQVLNEQKYTNNLVDDLLEPEYDEEKVNSCKINGVLGEVIYDESNISAGVCDELKPVVEKYKKCFSEISGLSKIKGYQMNIELKENFTPVRSAPFRLGWDDQEILEAYVKEMLDLDLIEKSQGTWTSPLFLIDKVEKGSKRVVCDLRRANEQIVKNNFPMATVSELTEATAGSKIFSVFDCTSGYHQLEINPDHREVTGFITKSGTYRYKVCPQGITNGCADYSRVICDIFKDFVGVFVYSFLDDVLVFSENLDDHAKHLELVFQACVKANLKLKRKKAAIGISHVEYLGHVIGADGTKPCKRNIVKIEKFPSPRNSTEVRSFLGLTGYYRKYIQNYASIASPLIKLTKKNCKFIWTEAEQEAFDILKENLMSAPILTYPDRNKVQVLSVDASITGLGAVLSQVDDFESMGNEQVISYASKTVSGPTANLSIHHLESLAAVWGVNQYKHYLKGRRFILITDCSSLLHTFKCTKTSPKLNRWSACLLDYDFDLRYRKGELNTSDLLSRRIIDLEQADPQEIIRIG